MKRIIEACAAYIGLLVNTVLNPRQWRVDPALNLFFLRYLGKFRLRRVGRHVVLHSHLPPLNSKAHSRFIREHLLGKTPGPSHAQLGVTDACPQRCACCYNRDRGGRPLEKAELLGVIAELKAMGLVWLGLTGGEPLLRADLAELVAAAADGCAVKLFTTGIGLTPARARELRQAGLFSVSVSLDHWDPARHDGGRRYPGAHAQALAAIEIFKAEGGIHLGASTVLPKSMLGPESLERLLEYLEGLGLHEAWLSETKPAVAAFGDEAELISPGEWAALNGLQDEWNRRRGLTVNYLGHFEDASRFGCNAGHKMIYVDAFGEVSPCVFTPMSFGNVRGRPVRELFAAMKARFPSESRCFINAHYRRLREAAAGESFIPPERSRRLLDGLSFGPYSRFFELYYRRRPA